MELQVSHSVCAKISKENIIRRKTSGDTRDIKDAVHMERGRNHRGRNMSRPRASAAEYTAQNTSWRRFARLRSVSGFMGYLKGKSSLMIFQKWGNMKFAYRNREFWCRGYYVDTVGKNTAAIKEYIANQLKADKESDQMSMFDPRDPLTTK